MITAITVAAMHTDRIALLRCIQIADVDIDHVDDRGWTPLHWVAHRGDHALAELLLKNGASPHRVTEKGKRAHELALDAGHLGLGEILRSRWLADSQPVLSPR